MGATVRSSSRGSAVGTVVPVARPVPAPVLGDQIWAFATCDEENLAGMTAPAGFVSAGTLVAANALPTKVWRKMATVGEPSSYSFGQPNASSGTVHVVCVRDASPTIPARLAFLASTAEDAPTPSVQPAAASHLEIRYAAVPTVLGTATFKEPSNYTMRTQAGVSGALASALATRQIASSAPSGVKRFTRAPTTVVGVAGVTVSIPSADDAPEVPPPPPFTPAAGSATFQYPFRRMIGDRAYLGHLDLTGVSFERRVSSPGTFSASVPITSERIADQVDAIIPRDRTQLNRGPGVIVAEILHEDEYWGEAWITGYTLRKDRRKSPVLTLRGVTLDAYFQHVKIRDDLEFTDVDQFEIARQLMLSMASRPHADLGLVLPAGMSGQLRDRTYKGADRAPYGQRLTELGDVINGFETTIDTITGSSGLERHLRMGAPTIGAPDAAHVFGQGRYGGDVLDWGYEVDALRGGTAWEARGDTPETQDASVAAEPLVSGLYEADAHLAAGWPAIERLVDRPGVKVQETLEEYAAGWAEKKAGAVTVFSVVVAIGENPSFTPNSIGDAARFVLSDEWHKRSGLGAGLNARHRIIGVRVLPATREQPKGEMELFVESSEVT
ncbi:hypothetical protein [Nonomuraea angiospora]